MFNATKYKSQEIFLIIIKKFKIFQKKRQSSILLLLKTKYNFPPKNNDIPTSTSPSLLPQIYCLQMCPLCCFLVMLVYSNFRLYEKKIFFREIERHMRGIDIVLMFFVTNKIDIL